MFNILFLQKKIISFKILCHNLLLGGRVLINLTSALFLKLIYNDEKTAESNTNKYSILKNI